VQGLLSLDAPAGETVNRRDGMRDLAARAVLLKACSLDRPLDEVRRAVEGAAGGAEVGT
jgi:hypothetical protein